MPKLSARLKGEPVLTEASEIVALRDLIKQRTPFLIAYLGLDGGGQRRARIKTAIENVMVYEVSSLQIRWSLDGQMLAVPANEQSSFTHHTESGWRLYLVARDRQQSREWDREPLAQTLLLACGLLPTREAANVRDILTFEEDRLDEKLTGLGVARETVEAAIAEASELREVALEQSETGRVTSPPLPPTVPAPTEPLRPPVCPGPQSPVAPPTKLVVPPQYSDIHLPERTQTVPRRRDHTDALDAQEWLRTELKALLRVTVWEVSDGERIIGQSRVDIVLLGTSEPYLIEVKQIERGKVYWRQEQIETAREQGRLHPGHYIVALVSSSSTDTHEVRWVFDPLSEFAVQRPGASWYWTELTAPSGMDENWHPVDPPPCVEPDRYKAVITLSQDFIENCPSGIEAILRHIVSSGRGLVA